MVSKSKYSIDDNMVKSIFKQAGIEDACDIAPLGAGEFNAVYSVNASGKGYALKIAPKNESAILTYEKDMMRLEVFWYDQLRKNNAVKVPRIYYYDDTKSLIPSSWFIMDRIEGKQMNEFQFTKAEKQNSVAEMAKMAAEIHKIKGEKFGYIQNGLYDNWYLAIKSMAENVLADCAEKGKKSPRGQKLLNYIDMYKQELKSAECCLVNFDINLLNIICNRDGDKINYFWIDPERSFWGDRVAEFVCLEIMTGYKNKIKSIEAYNKVADKPLLLSTDEEIRYAVAEAYLALIMETEKYFRYTPKHFGWWRNYFASMFFYKSAFKVLKKHKKTKY